MAGTETGCDERLAAARAAQAKNKQNYSDYLQLLSCQEPQSALHGHPVPDEMMFIIVHQVYELWFKLIIFEIDAVLAILTRDFVEESYVSKASEHFVQHRPVAQVLKHLSRVVEIQKVINEQFRIVETMTPQSFASFRDFIDPASGFQSAQNIREQAWATGPTSIQVLELRNSTSHRASYQSKAYHEWLEVRDRAPVLAAEEAPTLFLAVQHWLERVPFVAAQGWDFVDKYKAAITRTMEADAAAWRAAGLDEAELESTLTKSRTSFETMLGEFDEAKHLEDTHKGLKRLSFRAMVGALFIQCYADEPLLQAPAQLLNHLMEIDANLASWRFRHAMMVQRIIGNKSGTGGSTGHGYLKSTVERCRVFNDIFNLSGLTLPTDALPCLPPDMLSKMQFAIKEFTPMPTTPSRPRPRQESLDQAPPDW